MPKVLVEFQVALRQLRAHPLESALIIIALAVGVGALSAVAALYGVSDEIARRLRADLSTRQFTILSATADTYGRLSDEHLAAPIEQGHSVDLRFREEQIDELLELVPAVDHAYFVWGRGFVTAAVSQNWGPGSPLAGVWSVTEGYMDAASVPLSRGSWFSSSDHAESRAVVVISESEIDLIRLGITGDPLGQELPMDRSHGGEPYLVIGILDPEHELGDQSGYVPYSIRHTERPRVMYAVVDDFRQLPAAAEQLHVAVERIWDGAAIVRSPVSLWEAAAADQGRGLLLAGFASVGLLMACLNITILMMARVRRRGRSFAIMRSLGASRADIRRQVITEAGLLGLLGGILGLVLMQVFLTALFASAAQAVGDFSNAVVFPPIALLVALLATVGIAVALGLVPAIGAGNAAVTAGMQEATKELKASLPRFLRRNPARLAFSGLQLVISGVAIVTALHIVTLGDHVTPETDHFRLAANSPETRFATFTPDFSFTQDGIDGLIEFAPTISGLTIWYGQFGPAVAQVDGRNYALREIVRVGPGYLDMMGIQLVAGNPLGDATTIPTSLLLEEGVATVIFGSRDDALGQQITIRSTSSDTIPPPETFQVVGVYNYDNQPRHPLATTERVAAIAVAENLFSATRHIVASAESAESQEAREQLLAAANAIYSHRDDVLFEIEEVFTAMRLRQLVDQTSFIVSIMAVTAIILAALGILSLAILDTSERTREIGLKRALGASNGQIAREVTGATTAVAAAATLTGVVTAWLAAPVLTTSLSQSLLSGLTVPLQWVLALVTIGLIVLISSGTGWLVGQSAARANPGTVLAREGA